MTSRAPSGTVPARPPAPEPLPLPVMDNHTHLDHARAGEIGVGVQEAVEWAAAVNVTRMVQIGCDLDAARWTVQAVHRHPALVGGVALHPTEATRLAVPGDDGLTLAGAFAQIEQLAADPRIRVIGETGLDHYWVPADDVRGRRAQEESFRWHIDLAKRLGKVLQIHDRDAHDDVVRILREEGAPERTVFHCFSGDADLARVCVANGWVMSFAGTLTFKSAAPLREALAVAVPELIQVETDAPYLAPMPYRGRTNAGYLIPITVRCMAEVTGRPLEQVCTELNAVAQTLYGPW